MPQAATSQLDVVLYEPEIPPNTGNIIRLCANTGCRLHLIQPLGFTLEDKRMRRAGLDYSEYARVQLHGSLAAYCEAFPEARLLAVTTRGHCHYHDMRYQPGDALLFGPETRGLPPHVLDGLPGEQRVRIPMLAQSRSMNLSNAAAVMVYEALRQWEFPGLT